MTAAAATVNADIFKRDFSKGYWKGCFGQNDGVTVNFYSDRHACTVCYVSKSGNKIILKRDKATPNEKPKFVPGGFAGHCTNNHEITYTYEPDQNGKTYNAYWSPKLKVYIVDRCSSVSFGRHEFYDYNF